MPTSAIDSLVFRNMFEKFGGSSTRSSGRTAWKAAWKQERAFSSNSALAGHSTKWPPALIPISRLVAWQTSERYKARVRGSRASSTELRSET